MYLLRNIKSALCRRHKFSVTSHQRNGVERSVRWLRHSGGRRARGKRSQIISELKEIACLRHATCGMPLPHPQLHSGLLRLAPSGSRQRTHNHAHVETCHGASLRLCHAFSYLYLIFAAEKNEHEQVWLWEI